MEGQASAGESPIRRVPGRMGVAAYLVLGPEPLLVDAGMKGDAGAILAGVRRAGVEPRALRYLVFTHYHQDHVGGAPKILAESGAATLAHRDDVAYVEGREEPPAAKLFPLWLLSKLVLGKPQPVHVDRPLADGDEVAGLVVYHTPGHTPGSICLYHPPSKSLIVGDLVRGGRGQTLVTPPSFFTADVEQENRSVRRIAEMDVENLYPAHGRPVVGNARQALRELVARLP